MIVVVLLELLLARERDRNGTTRRAPAGGAEVPAAGERQAPAISTVPALPSTVTS